MGFINKYGLINPTSKDVVSENTLLTSMVYQYLERLALKENNYKLDNNIEFFVHECYNFITLMYNNTPISNPILNRRDRLTSPDQLMCYILYSYTKGYIGHYQIWKYLRTHYFTYNNILGEFSIKEPRFMQPMIIFLAGYCAGIKWFKIPLICCLKWSLRASKDKTSGKQKAFLIQALLGLKISYNWRQVFEIYYKESTHPIRRLINNVSEIN